MPKTPHASRGGCSSDGLLAAAARVATPDCIVRRVSPYNRRLSGGAEEPLSPQREREEPGVRGRPIPCASYSAFTMDCAALQAAAAEVRLAGGGSAVRRQAPAMAYCGEGTAPSCCSARRISASSQCSTI